MIGWISRLSGVQIDSEGKMTSGHAPASMATYSRLARHARHATNWIRLASGSARMIAQWRQRRKKLLIKERKD